MRQHPEHTAVTDVPDHPTMHWSRFLTPTVHSRDALRQPHVKKFLGHGCCGWLHASVNVGHRNVLLRELAYKYIQENVDEAALAEAEAFDKIIRKQAIDARVEGKAKKAWEVLGLDKLTQSEQAIDASN